MHVQTKEEKRRSADPCDIALFNIQVFQVSNWKQSLSYDVQVEMSH